MTERRRRGTFRGSLRRAGTAVREFPLRLAQMLPTRKKEGRRSERKWTRAKRITVGLTTLAVLGGGAVAVVVVSNMRDPAREVWRLHDQTVEHFHAGRFAEAAAASRKILAINPDDAIARFNLGAALLKLDRADEAWTEIRAVANAHPDFDQAHLLLADAALARGDDQTALAELRLVVANPPTSGAAEWMTAAALRRHGREAEAIPHLVAAYEDQSAEPLVRIDSAMALGRIHGLRAAFHRTPDREKQKEIEYYGAARQLADGVIGQARSAAGPETAALHAARGRALIALGRPAEALADIDVALKAATDPGMRSELRLVRAQIYRLANDEAAAEAELVAALASDAKPSADALRSVSAFYVARGKTARGVEMLARGVALYPSDVELGLDHASLLFATGRVAEADAECARLESVAPKAAGPLLFRGDLRRAADDLEGARKAYEAALARDPSDTQARLRIAGTAFSESGARSPDAAARLAEAERVANEVLAVAPDDAGALLALGKVRLAQSKGPDTKTAKDPRNAEAHALLTRAVDGDPLSLEARTFLAYADYLTQNAQEAAFGLDRVLSAMPADRPKLRLLLAHCLLDAGSFVRAADEARRVTEALPDDADAWTTLSRALRGAGDREGTVAALRHVETLEPANLRPLFDEAMVLTEMGKFAAAEERLAAADEKAAAIKDENERAAMEITIAEQRAYFLRLRGNVAGAKAVFGALVGKGPPTAAAYVRYAKFLIRLGQNDEAEAQVERGIAVEPANVEARRTLCEIWFARGEASPVLVNQVQEVARTAGKDPVVDYLRGKLSALQGDLKVGVELLTRYTAAVPDDPDGHYALGAVLAKSTDFPEAVRQMERAGELMPGSPEVRVALAKIRQAWAFEMLRRGRFVEAQATLRRAAVDDPTSRDVRALLADSLRFTGQVDLSEKEVRGLLHADPNDRAALRMLAAIHVQTGKFDDAAVALRHLTDVAPDDWSAWSFLSAVLADKGDLDGAEVAAKTARTTAPDEPGALAALLHVLSKRDGGRAAAEREIDAAIAKHPEEAQYPYFLAILREQEGRHEEAAAAAAKSLDLRPSNPAALQIAIAALSSGVKDSERAAAFARERVAKARDDTTMAYQLAQIEAQIGHRDAALAVLKPICEAPMPYFPALTLQGLLLVDARDWPAARAAMTKGIEQYADGVDLHYLLAQSWLQDPASSKDGEPQDPARGFAVAELRTVLRIAKNHAPALNNLAWLLSRDEPTRAEALQLAEAAVRLFPGSPDYLDTWGTVLLRLGRAPHAVEAFRRALGACEDARKALEKEASAKLSAAETARFEVRKRRLEASTSSIRAHHDEALKASGGR